MASGNGGSFIILVKPIVSLFPNHTPPNKIDVFVKQISFWRLPLEAGLKIFALYNALISAPGVEYTAAPIGA